MLWTRRSTKPTIERFPFCNVVVQGILTIHVLYRQYYTGLRSYVLFSCARSLTSRLLTVGIPCTQLLMVPYGTCVKQ